MRITLVVLLMLNGMPAWAQPSSLPACEGSLTNWIHCAATVSYPDGAKYAGEFRDGKRNGQGSYAWPDGSKYVGELRNDKPHGQGTYAWPDGRKYVGEYRDDKLHGQGAATNPDGSVFHSGTWADDKPIR